MLYPVVRALNLDPRFSANTIAFPDSQLYATPAFQSFAPIPSNSVVYDPDWVSFDERNWQNIVSFTRWHNLKHIVNIQNEGPLYDKGYYRFRSVHAADYSFWDLDFAKIYHSNEKVHILDSVRAMLAANGTLWWYPPRQRLHGIDARGLTCYVGGSEANKCWPSTQWVSLITQLSNAIKHETVSVISGNSGEERAELEAIRQQIRETPSVIFPGSGTLDENIDRIARCKLLLTHDTYPIHLASLLFIPTIGLYFATDPVIWGSYYNQFRYIASSIECSGKKQGTGNCVHFHTSCSNIDEIKVSVTVEDVFSRCISMLNDLR
jgi:ADP-heptose:LPS heptosyltransferase